MTQHSIGNKALTALVLLVCLAGESAMGLEKPDYEVVLNTGDVEFRQYAPYLVAETLVQDRDGYQAAGNEGFRRLFRYITGSNRAQQDIAMTAPVAQAQAEKIAMTAPVQQSGSTEGWRVAFMLPKKYSLETAPVPTDGRVAVREIPGRLMAVIRYSGRWTQRNFEKGKTRLEQAIASAEIQPVGAIETAMYDPPYKPPFMRRNEVMVEVSGVPATIGSAKQDIRRDGYAMMSAGLAD